MKATPIIAVIIALVVGIAIGFFLFGNDKNRKDIEKPGFRSAKPGTVDMSGNIPEEIQKEGTDKIRGSDKIHKRIDEVKKEEQRIDKGSRLTSKPEINTKTRDEIQEEKKHREEMLASKLPMDTTNLKKLASEDDPSSLQKAMSIYRSGDPANISTIEFASRSNPELNQQIQAEIRKNLSSSKEDIRTQAVRSAIRIRAFDEPFKEQIRPLLSDPSAQVRHEALAYAGWSRDREAFEKVLDRARTSEKEKEVVSSLHCIGSLGSDSPEEAAPVLLKKLQSESPAVRRAALSSAVRIKGILKRDDIREVVEKIAQEDPYRITGNGKEQYPLREQASRGLEKK